MTDAELIEMLRSSANRVVNYAADRIEQLVATTEALTAERDEALEWLSASRGYIAASAVFALDRAEKAEADNARLREVVLEADKLLCGDLAGLQWRRECRSFLVWARAVLKGESHD